MSNNRHGAGSERGDWQESGTPRPSATADPATETAAGTSTSHDANPGSDAEAAQPAAPVAGTPKGASEAARARRARLAEQPAPCQSQSKEHTAPTVAAPPAQRPASPARSAAGGRPPRRGDLSLLMRAVENAKTSGRQISDSAGEASGSGPTPDTDAPAAASGKARRGAITRTPMPPLTAAPASLLPSSALLTLARASDSNRSAEAWPVIAPVKRRRPTQDGVSLLYGKSRRATLRRYWRRPAIAATAAAVIAASGAVLYGNSGAFGPWGAGRDAQASDDGAFGAAIWDAVPAEAATAAMDAAASFFGRASLWGFGARPPDAMARAPLQPAAPNGEAPLAASQGTMPSLLTGSPVEIASAISLPDGGRMISAGTDATPARPARPERVALQPATPTALETGPAGGGAPSAPTGPRKPMPLRAAPAGPGAAPAIGSVALASRPTGSAPPPSIGQDAGAGLSGDVAVDAPEAAPPAPASPLAPVARQATPARPDAAPGPAALAARPTGRAPAPSIGDGIPVRLAGGEAAFAVDAGAMTGIGAGPTRTAVDADEAFAAAEAQPSPPQVVPALPAPLKTAAVGSVSPRMDQNIEQALAAAAGPLPAADTGPSPATALAPDAPALAEEAGAVPILPLPGPEPARAAAVIASLSNEPPPDVEETPAYAGTDGDPAVASLRPETIRFAAYHPTLPRIGAPPKSAAPFEPAQVPAPAGTGEAEEPLLAGVDPGVRVGDGQTAEIGFHPDAVPPGTPRVVVHFTKTDGSEQALATALLLEQAGVSQVDLVAVPFEISSNNTRFYHEDDQSFARKVRFVMESQGAGVEMRDFTNYTPAPREGLVEIWLASGDAS